MENMTFTGTGLALLAEDSTTHQKNSSWSISTGVRTKNECHAYCVAMRDFHSEMGFNYCRVDGTGFVKKMYPQYHRLKYVDGYCKGGNKTSISMRMLVGTNGLTFYNAEVEVPKEAIKLTLH